MKIKVSLFAKEQWEELDANPELREALESIGLDWKNPSYIELDDGGAFNDLSEENQERLKNGLGVFLRRFGQLLMAATNFDFIIGEELLGIKAIRMGFEVMDTEMEVVARRSREIARSTI